MLKPVSLFTLAAACIVGVWWWLGAGVAMPPSPLAAGEKLYCVSYAPFRGAQTPLDLSTRISPQQIEEDLALLAQLTDCVRTYSVDFGLDRVPAIAQRHGLKVLLGLWVSSHADRTKWQIDTGVALAKRFPDVIRAVIVGNEALLRGEVSREALAALIGSVKRQVPMPVTYADVWEFWLRNRELATTVDFVTIHILPYWEDHPIPAREAADHIASIRQRVVGAFPDKEIVIGEVGWPSGGRMREGALPSPSNQARVLHDIFARAKQGNFRVNVIEAFDQPWKRFQEGSVGGAWGLFKDSPRVQKFSWGSPVSDHPRWPWQAAGGVAFAALVFAASLVMRRRSGSWDISARRSIAIAITAAASGVLLGWTIEQVSEESFGIGGWLRSLAWTFVAFVAPLAAAVGLAVDVPAPSFAGVIGPRDQRVPSRLAMALGVVLILLTVLTLQAALGLAFDPRYRDFPFAPLTAAVVPFLLLSLASRRPATARPAAETVVVVLLVFSALYVLWNEGIANWQAVWFCVALALLAFTLARARAEPD
jgi:glucan 1,3-beta-glucosidase